MSGRRVGRPVGSTNRPDAQKTGPKSKRSSNPITSHFPVIPRQDPLGSDPDDLLSADGGQESNARIQQQTVETAVSPDGLTHSSIGCQTHDTHLPPRILATSRTHTYVDQGEFVSSIKATVNDAMKRNWGKSASGTYPFSQLLIYPDDPTMCRTSPRLSNFYLKPVFVFIPEFVWPQLFPHGRPPCPNCSEEESHVIVNNWIQPRRITLEDRCGELLGYRYKKYLTLDISAKRVLVINSRVANQLSTHGVLTCSLNARLSYNRRLNSL